MSETEQAATDLQADWSILRQQWKETVGQWRDNATAAFDRDYWHQWESQTPAFLAAIREVDYAIEEALRNS